MTWLVGLAIVLVVLGLLVALKSRPGSGAPDHEAERQLRQREAALAQRGEAQDVRERQLRERDEALGVALAQAQQALRDAEGAARVQAQELERIAGLSREAAKAELVRHVEEAAKRQAAERVRAVEDEARREATERSQRVLAAAVQRYAGAYVAEKTVSVVELPSDDMKGRIIGREGRNIRALEHATGVDVIIDDTPEVVVLSAFSPTRREIARLALERLVADGRIHPARIEEVVEQVTAEMDELTQRAGEEAVFDLGLHGVHPDLVRAVGRLRHRSVGGQNLWNHSVETATLTGLLAAELGLDAGLGKRAGLLHDIGKTVDHETPGEHAAVGAELARRCGEKPEVVQAIAHYHDAEPPSVLAVLLQVCDGVSKARPGARREQQDSYVKRLTDLEALTLGFEGVDKAYAIQAGREVRVLVNYDDVSDADALALSSDIARRIQDSLTYPGEVRVTVIREARATEIAR